MALYYIRENETIIKESENDIVVISPTLYWYAFAQFPTKSLAKARRLADAYLDSRPESYRDIHVEKKEEGFDCYAYDKEYLTAKLEELGVSKAPAYFLQQLSSQMPLRIDEKLVADVINGICIELPDESRTLPTLDSLDFEAVAKPFNKRGSATVPKKPLIALVALLSITMLLDLSLRYQQYAAIRDAIEKIGLDRSVYELKSLVTRYEKRASEQAKLRQAIRKALKQQGLKKLKCTPAKGCRYE
ncbi:hypothetical protein [Hydrogenimonas urashimensis]|uniref:hypothetical protein n=1 Tax=Hydrogenimonas urashimensis TaxID=2740515 RepID=UPI0019159936|nr:hypothetical protein [Hydrogenimonas urashimensis]